MVSSILQLDVTYRLNKNGITIEFAVKVLLLNKIWTTRIIGEHVSTGYSNTNVDQESLFFQKRRPLIRNTELGILRCYSQLEEPSNYSARILYVDSLNIKAFPLRIAYEVQSHTMIEAQFNF